LAGIELMSQVLEQNLTGKSKGAADRVGEIAAHVRDAISQTRALARGLSPVTLESEGLMAALHELTVMARKMFNVDCTFRCDQPVLLNDQTIASQLFRIAQEAVSNAIRHGKARHVVIQLKEHRRKIVVSVSDDGLGFPKAIPQSKGMGLRIMQSRAGMIGATLALDNIPTGGARVSCTVSRKSRVKGKADHRGGKKET
jgi:signal transduction histidine kinase